MRHSKNTATIVDVRYEKTGADFRIYVHNEAGKFVTVVDAYVPLDRLEEHAEKVRAMWNASQQLELPF